MRQTEKSAVPRDFTMEKTRYFESEGDDFFAPTGYKLKDGYVWVNDGFLRRIAAFAVYSAALLFSLFYCRLHLKVKIVGALKLRREKRGFFLFGNHTQPIGDVFTPALCCFPKRIYTVVAAENLGLPFIGRLLPALGALPLADTPSGMRKFGLAVRRRIEQGHPVVVYPEAHVWEYYVGIRRFSDGAFRLPARLGAPVYSFTVTYQKRGKSEKKRPRSVVYIDGPFDFDGGVRERAAALCEAVYGAMVKNSGKSDCEYIKYIKKEGVGK